MLIELRIKNFGIIENLTWKLHPGFNVITGETGAGKSLIIDAIEVLLSGKSNDEIFRHGTSESQIEGVFSIPLQNPVNPVKDLLAERGLNNDEETLVIDCRFRKNSPNIFRLNGNAISRSFLSQLGRLLVDIHGQSEHLSLLDVKTHLEFLDSFAHALDTRKCFFDKATELFKTTKEIQELTIDDSARVRREKFLRFQIDEISRAQLHSGEEEELNSEMTVLSSSEKLKELSYKIYSAINEETGMNHSASTIDRLNEALQMMRKLVTLDPTLNEQLKYMDEVTCGLSEIVRDIRNYHENIKYDVDRINEIESRFVVIRDLKRKYGQTIDRIIEYRKKLEEELEQVNNHALQLTTLKERCSFLKQEMGEIAYKLSLARSNAANELMDAVKNELGELDMSHVSFRVLVTREENVEGIPFPDGSFYAFTPEGTDNVAFNVSTNPGEPEKLLSKIASTGELSRFTLALKSTLSETDNIPVVIFDEIDIGVGGRSGEIIGKKLWNLSRNHQVICITHLPQIAAFADAHFGVSKVTSENRTTSILQEFQHDNRVKEIAMMLTGTGYTHTSMNSARELISRAQTWKTTKKRKTSNIFDSD